MWAERIERRAALAAGAPALLGPDKTLRFRALVHELGRWRAHLRACGVGPEGRVIGVGTTSVDGAVRALGITASATYTPFAAQWGSAAVEELLEHVRPHAMIVDAETPEGLVAQAQARGIRLVPGSLPPQTEARPMSPEERQKLWDPERVALISHTSGTTQRKFIPYTNGNITALCDDARGAWRLSSQDRCLTLAPLFNGFGLLLGVCVPVVAGGSTLVGFPFTPPSFWSTLAATEATWVLGVPLVFQVVLDIPGPPTPALRMCVTGGTSMNAAVAERLRRRTRVALVDAYGMNEAGLIASTPVSLDPVPAGCVGHPYGLDVAVWDPEEDVALAATERGEVVVRGASVARSYFANGERTTPRASEWLRTGDEGFFDEGGALYLTGRMWERINQGGETISPGLIEQVLLSHPAVQDAACFATPHPRLGEAVAAAVVIKGQVSDAELRARVVEQLGLSHVPQVLLRCPSLPRAPNGKLNRRGLHETFQTSIEEPRQERGDDLLVVAIAEVFAAVLGVPEVSHAQSFFALGGDSLAVSEVVTRLRISLGRAVTITDVFTHPSPVELATQVRATEQVEDVPLMRLPPQSGRGGRASFGQERMWVHQQLYPESDAYNELAIWTVRGSVKADLLERALRWLVARHAVLRDRLVMMEGVLRQQDCQPPSPLLRRPSACADVAEGLAAVQREAAVPYDLAEEAPSRFWLVPVGSDATLFALGVHHAMLDGISAAELCADLGEAYRALLQGNEPAREPLPFRYTDWAWWQRQQVEANGAAQLSWWRERLAGAPSVLPLPLDRPRPRHRAFQGRSVGLSLDAQQRGAILALAEAHGCTPYMVLLAVYALVLARTCACDDLVIGTPVSVRNHPSLAGVIGFFVNTLPLRLDLGGATSGAVLLRQVRRRCLEAFERRDVPFEHVVDALGVRRDEGHEPLVQVLFSYQNELLLELDGAAVEPLRLERMTAQVDLSLLILNERDGLWCSFEYDAELFERSTLSSLAESFHQLLLGLIAHPERRVSDLPMVLEADQEALLELGRGPVSALPPMCLHALFERQADATPEATALVFGSASMSYAELERRANGVAHQLRAQGVPPGSRVGLSYRSAPEQIAAVLGILKAGCAYVPLDPDDPASRRAFIVEDAGVGIVVTQASLAERWGTQTVVLLEESVPSDRRPALDVDPSQGAYVIYTSGSTGQPKGAEIHHGAAAAVVRHMAGILQIDPTSRVLRHASIGFDASVVEIFSTLGAGATMILAELREQLGPSFTELLRHHRVTHLQMVPSALAQVEDEDALPDLQVVLSCGEVCPPSLAKRWRVGRRFLNGYGPSECTIYSTVSVDPSGVRLPIGRPLPGVRLYVLDTQRRLAPAGLPGELYIGGVGVGLGYIGRPALDAERFLPDPFGPPGARMYRSGDRCRWRSDGELEFLGRVDLQLKLRGIRIEPGEIESCLCEHPAIEQAVVVPRDGRLVAYHVQRAPVSPAALRAHVQALLPAPMVPAAYVALAVLPRLPSGKVDRGALPIPQADALGVDEPYLAPRTDVEVQIAAIWAEVLEVPEVGVSQDFFALGGDSLKAVLIVRRTAAVLGRPVPIGLLLKRPTIAGVLSGLGPTSSAAPPRPRPTRPESPHLKVVDRSLPELFLGGEIPPVEAAYMGYVFDEHLARLTPEERLQAERELLTRPSWVEVLDTSLGRSAGILLPHRGSALYLDQEALVASVVTGLELAARIGARVVALTGLLPSATDYGEAIARAISGRTDLPAITTGHGATAAAVLMNLERLLDLSGRTLAREHVAVLGLGSIGRTSLRLMLARAPHPAVISLCDLYQQRAALQSLKEELRAELGFRGGIELLEVEDALPASLHKATTVIGATNVANVLDVDKLAPGTLIVDDSGPHCFDVAAARRRFKDHGDILFIEGGPFESPDPVRVTTHPSSFRASHDGRTVMGCILSSSLSVAEGLAPTIGLITPAQAEAHLDALRARGFRGAWPQCDGVRFSASDLAAFAGRFGDPASREQTPST
ncbi:MAG: amino acid adenylation domain-containing protein [Alphaproteobacteria bacterium]|nr:amino acid adenylation domain-containing protein [Alphaproteobacteria bacterium]